MEDHQRLEQMEQSPSKRGSIPLVDHRRHLRLLHLSDTHDMHDKIEEVFPLPDADVFLHTGDLTNHGTLEELQRVNEWFGNIKHRFKHMLVIAGNHDVHGPGGNMDLKQVLTNVTVLHHEPAVAVLNEFGLSVFGSPWSACKPASNPGGKGHLFDQIPEGVDILMTHGPPKGIFDTAGYMQSWKKANVDETQTEQLVTKCLRWGSSADLNDAIKRARPRVHLFGHLHEQRGVWQRNSVGDYIGGVEYEPVVGSPFPTTGAPPVDWPCDLVSCNAMCNHGGHEQNATGAPSIKHIAGPARLIVASRSGEMEPWQFTAISQ